MNTCCLYNYVLFVLQLCDWYYDFYKIIKYLSEYKSLSPLLEKEKGFKNHKLPFYTF